MNHHASSRFWALYEALSEEIRRLADKNFELLKADSRHPSLRLKRVAEFWSVRVGDHYRALGVDADDGILWIWIGTHADYDELVG